jgi:glucan 1,3-beta-glucosidase
MMLAGDVHTRIGGAKGTGHQVAECPTDSQKPECYASHTNVHVTKSASNVYMENNWFWVSSSPYFPQSFQKPDHLTPLQTADHDLDDPSSTRVSIYTGRGLLVEGSNVWLYSSGVEHHAIYQYQFAGAKDVFAGYIQTETPYWQPTPDARTQPFPRNEALRDPDYNSFCPEGICDALGLRILDSENLLFYGIGLYSFFKSYDVSCSSDSIAAGRRDCQNRIASIEGNTSNVQAYSFNQVGALQMLTVDGVDKASWEENLSVYSNTIGYLTYRT